MKLKFIKQHKSIRNLLSCELPNFAILTGINGAGKTHLLEAIANQAVNVDELPRKDGEIRLFNWINFVAKISENASPEQIYKKRENAIVQVLNSLESSRQHLVSYLTSNKIEGDQKCTDTDWLVMATLDQITDVMNKCTKNGSLFKPDESKKMAASFIQNRTAHGTGFLKSLENYGNLATMLKNNYAQKQETPLAYTESDVRRSFPLTWSSSNTLHLELANWFSAWHSAWEYNKIAKYYNTIENDLTKFFLSEEDFKSIYGSEPWDITNETLRTAGFRHQFAKPITRIGDVEQTFQLRLEDPEDGALIKIDELSSGEKILLSVTLMLHHPSNNQNLVRLPKLLLLDEIDAPLHPAFTKSLIEILRVQFVEKFGVAVLLTTHSPSTVALSPPETIYELVRRPRSIRQVSKSAATQVLSAGYISITPSDIIVITESSDDPEYYQPIYEALCLQANIPTEPPLKFIAASAKNNDGEGGGCLQVRNWAPKLHELGLHRFRGLIDNDGTNKEDEIISVLRRYSIENYLFDPLTLVAYLLHRAILLPFEISAPAMRPVQDLFMSDPISRHKLLSSMCRWLSEKTGKKEIFDSPLVKCEYMGFAHDIPSWWTNCRGHELESTVRAPLNTLGVETGRGALLRAGNRSEMITFQTRTYPELISKDFVEIFLRLKQS